jgi:hypothetical protein
MVSAVLSVLGVVFFAIFLLSEEKINLRFNNSYVDHVRLAEHDYIEGPDNGMSGTLIDGELLFAGTNSHGDPTYMKGRARIFGKCCFIWGHMHGYKKYPQGRWIAAFAWRGHKQIYFVTPYSIKEMLLVRVDYEII